MGWLSAPAIWLGLVICGVALAANVAIHLTSYRLTKGYMKAAFAGFGAGAVVMIVGEGIRFTMLSANLADTLFLLIGDAMIYGCGSFLFFNFVNAGESSIRIRILRELVEMPPPRTEAGLLARYNDRLIVDTRLGRLLRNGQIESVDGRFRLRATTMARIAAIMTMLKWTLLRKGSEFDLTE